MCCNLLRSRLVDVNGTGEHSRVRLLETILHLRPRKWLGDGASLCGTLGSSLRNDRGRRLLSPRVSDDRDEENQAQIDLTAKRTKQTIPRNDACKSASLQSRRDQISIAPLA